jgi:hypothetical protein
MNLRWDTALANGRDKMRHRRTAVDVEVFTGETPAKRPTKKRGKGR